MTTIANRAANVNQILVLIAFTCKGTPSSPIKHPTQHSDPELPRAFQERKIAAYKQLIPDHLTQELLEVTLTKE